MRLGVVGEILVSVVCIGSCGKNKDIKKNLFCLIFVYLFKGVFFCIGVFKYCYICCYRFM